MFPPSARLDRYLRFHVDAEKEKMSAIGGLALFTARQLRRPKLGDAGGGVVGADGLEGNTPLEYSSVAAGNPERDVEAPKEDECIDGVLSDPLVLRLRRSWLPESVFGSSLDQVRKHAKPRHNDTQRQTQTHDDRQNICLNLVALAGRDRRHIS